MGLISKVRGKNVNETNQKATQEDLTYIQPVNIPANRNLDDKIALISKRIQELKDVNIDGVEILYGHELSSLSDRCNHTLVKIFGERTLDEKYQIRIGDVGDILRSAHPSANNVFRDRYRKDISKAISTLETIKLQLEENIS